MVQKVVAGEVIDLDAAALPPTTCLSTLNKRLLLPVPSKACGLYFVLRFRLHTVLTREVHAVLDNLTFISLYRICKFLHPSGIKRLLYAGI